jgi:hypothetical protein
MNCRRATATAGVRCAVVLLGVNSEKGDSFMSKPIIIVADDDVQELRLLERDLKREYIVIVSIFDPGEE